MAKMNKKTAAPLSGRRSNDSRDLVCRPFTCRAETFDAEARTVEAVIATETPVAAFDFRFGQVDEIILMSGAQLPKRMPLLNSHDRGSIEGIAGSVRNFRVEGPELIGTLHLAEIALGDLAAGLIRGEHLTDVSVGYRVLKQTTLPAGESAKIHA